MNGSKNLKQQVVGEVISDTRGYVCPDATEDFAIRLLEIQIMFLSLFWRGREGVCVGGGRGFELSPFHRFLSYISLHLPTLHSFPVLNYVHPLPASGFCF